MKLAVDSFSYHLHFGKHWFAPSEKYDLLWYCDICKKLKLDGLHIDPMHIDLDTDVKWLKEYADKNKMYIELGGIGTSIKSLYKSINAAHYLGSKVLRTFIGGSMGEGREAEEMKVKKAKADLVESIRIAEEYNIIIALENHADISLENLRDVLDINSPFLGLCYDAGNFYSVGDDPLEAVKMFADKIVCTHLKDVCPPDTYDDAETFGSGDHKTHFCALGEGQMPLKEIMDVIRKAKGNDFNITLEIHTPYRKSLREEALLNFEIENVNKSVDYARNILGII